MNFFSFEYRPPLNYFGEYIFLRIRNLRIKIEFDESDLISDLDGPLILSNKNDTNNFADLIGDYNKNYTPFFFILT